MRNKLNIIYLEIHRSIVVHVVNAKDILRQLTLVRSRVAGLKKTKWSNVKSFFLQSCHLHDLAEVCLVYPGLARVPLLHELCIILAYLIPN